MDLSFSGLLRSTLTYPDLINYQKKKNKFVIYKSDFSLIDFDIFIGCTKIKLSETKNQEKTKTVGHS